MVKAPAVVLGVVVVVVAEVVVVSVGLTGWHGKLSFNLGRVLCVPCTFEREKS